MEEKKQEVPEIIFKEGEVISFQLPTIKIEVGVSCKPNDD
jgi:hypothetical protein